MHSAVNRGYVSSTLTLSAILLVGCATSSLPRIPDIILDFKDNVNCDNLSVGPKFTWHLDGNMRPVKVNKNTRQMESSVIPHPNILLRCESIPHGEIRAEDIIRETQGRLAE